MGRRAAEAVERPHHQRVAKFQAGEACFEVGVAARKYPLRWFPCSLPFRHGLQYRKVGLEGRYAERLRDLSENRFSHFPVKLRNKWACDGGLEPKIAEMEEIMRCSAARFTKSFAPILVISATALGGCTLIPEGVLAKSWGSMPIVAVKDSGGKISTDFQDSTLPPPVNLDNDEYLIKKCKFSDAALQEKGINSADNNIRNCVQDYLIQRADMVCQVKKGQIVGTAQVVDGSLATLATVLGGAGALVTGQTGARILSGMAGMTSGVKGNLDSSIWQNNIATSISKSIEGKMKEERDRILVKRIDVLYSYPTSLAIADAVRYSDLCSFASGLSNLTEAAAKIGSSGITVESRLDALRTQFAKNTEIINGLTSSEMKKQKDALTGC